MKSNHLKFKSSLIALISTIGVFWVIGKTSGVERISQLALYLFPESYYYSSWWRFFQGAFLGTVSDFLLAVLSLSISIVFLYVMVPFKIPIGRLSRIVSFFLVTIPAFVVIAVVIYWFPFSMASLWMSLLIGIIVSARMMILIGNRLDDLERDEYVIFLTLGGKSRYLITTKYSYSSLVETIFKTLAWNFTTSFTFIIFVSFLSIGGIQRVSLGGYIRLIYDNFNALAIVERGNVKVLLGGLLRYSPAILAFLLIDYLVRSTLTGLSRYFLKKYGISKILFSRSKVDSRGSISGGIKELSIDSLRISSKFLGNLIINHETPINFSSGEKVLIMGESGVGKTLFVSSVVGMVGRSKLNVSGKVRIISNKLMEIEGDFERILDAGIVEYVPQNPRDSFDRYTKISSYLGDIGILENVREILLEKFDTDHKKFSQDLEKFPSDVSDGVLQVINFAVTYERSKGGGKIVILDEPTASLSYESLDKVSELIKEGIMNDNLVFWIDHDPVIGKKFEFDKFILVERDGSSSSRAKLIPREDFVGMLKKKEEARSIFEEMIRRFQNEEQFVVDFHVEEVKFESGGKLRIGIKRSFKKGNVYFIIGENGAGKSTLMKVLIGYYRNFKGCVRYYKNLDIKRSEDRKEIWRSIDVLLQNAGSSLPEYALVGDLVPDDRFLNLVGIGSWKNHRVYQLSYGQRKRLMLARIFSKNADVIFLDEPNASLDVENFINILRSLSEDHKNRKTTLVIITHDIYVLPFEVDRKLLRKGINILGGETE